MPRIRGVLDSIRFLGLRKWRSPTGTKQLLSLFSVVFHHGWPNPHICHYHVTFQYEGNSTAACPREGPRREPQDQPPPPVHTNVPRNLVCPCTDVVVHVFLHPNLWSSGYSMWKRSCISQQCGFTSIGTILLLLLRMIVACNIGFIWLDSCQVSIWSAKSVTQAICLLSTAKHNSCGCLIYSPVCSPHP